MAQDYVEINKNVSAAMPLMEASLIAVLRRSDGTHGAIRVSAFETMVNVDATDQKLSVSVRAKARHNEEGILNVCSLFLEKLNLHGERWTDLRCSRERASDVDCMAVDHQGRFRKMQVTRATNIERFWRQIGKGGEIREDLAIDDAVQQLKNAIESKSKLPDAQKKELLLILDATETPWQAFSQVIASFRANHGAWAMFLCCILHARQIITEFVSCRVSPHKCGEAENVKHCEKPPCIRTSQSKRADCLRLGFHEPEHNKFTIYSPFVLKG